MMFCHTKITKMSRFGATHIRCLDLFLAFCSFYLLQTLHCFKILFQCLRHAWTRVADQPKQPWYKNRKIWLDQNLSVISSYLNLLTTGCLDRDLNPGPGLRDRLVLKNKMFPIEMTSPLTLRDENPLSPTLLSVHPALAKIKDRLVTGKWHFWREKSWFTYELKEYTCSADWFVAADWTKSRTIEEHGPTSFPRRREKQNHTTRQSKLTDWRVLPSHTFICRLRWPDSTVSLASDRLDDTGKTCVSTPPPSPKLVIKSCERASLGGHVQCEGGCHNPWVWHICGGGFDFGPWSMASVWGGV